MARVEVKAEADADLDNIFDYSVAVFGLDTAVEYMDGFRRAFDRLAENPRLGPPVADVNPPLRSLSHRSHRIYYTLDGDTILIVRIFHTSRDAANLLN
jgi:toxin ParE1/3/4